MTSNILTTGALAGLVLLVWIAGVWIGGDRARARFIAREAEYIDTQAEHQAAYAAQLEALNTHWEDVRLLQICLRDRLNWFRDYIPTLDVPMVTDVLVTCYEVEREALNGN